MNQYFYDLMNSNSGNLHIQDILIRISFAVLMGLVIYISYKYTNTRTVYSKKFNLTLVTLTVLITTGMITLNENIALSLGVIAILSIVRFRTSIRNNRDAIYILWAVIIGVTAGVGDYLVASIGSTAVFLLSLLFGQVKNEDRILIIIKASRTLEQEIRSAIFDYFPKAPTLKVKNSTPNQIELIYEVNERMLEKAEKLETKKSVQEQRPNQSLLDILYSLEGIEHANIVVQSDQIT